MKMKDIKIIASHDQGKTTTNNSVLQNVVVSYSDGKDYSHLIANTDEHPEHDECVYCFSNNQTITLEADICHECGEVYT